MNRKGLIKLICLLIPKLIGIQMTAVKSALTALLDLVFRDGIKLRSARNCHWVLTRRNYATNLAKLSELDIVFAPKYVFIELHLAKNVDTNRQSCLEIKRSCDEPARS